LSGHQEKGSPEKKVLPMPIQKKKSGLTMPFKENLLFPISRLHLDFLPAWSSIIAIKLIFYSLFALYVLV